MKRQKIESFRPILAWRTSCGRTDRAPGSHRIKAGTGLEVFRDSDRQRGKKEMRKIFFH